MSSRSTRTVAEVVDGLLREFPAGWAEPWDRVGLIAGDPAARVSGVLVSLDASAEAVARAAEAGANLLITHHPPFLEPPATIAPGPGPAGTLEAAARLGIAVASFHTNLDRSPAGADALSRAIGLAIEGPLEQSAEEVSLVVTYAPPADAARVREAMSAAGAGRLGEYEGCAFVSEGTGHFTALPGSRPVVASEETGIPEVRIEMIAPRERAAAVLDAVRDVHPYEEPVVIALDAQRARGVARLGRLCRCEPGTTAASLAAACQQRLGVASRVWGDAREPVLSVAVANGSGGSLLHEAQAAADAMITGEVRYHDALDAVARGLVIIEVGHDVSEWPIVSVLADRVRAHVGEGIAVELDPPHPVWQTMEGPHDRG